MDFMYQVPEDLFERMVNHIIDVAYSGQAPGPYTRAGAHTLIEEISNHGQTRAVFKAEMVKHTLSHYGKLPGMLSVMDGSP